jgi:integrase
MAKKDKFNRYLTPNKYDVWYFQHKIRNGRRYKFSLKTKSVGKARKLRDQYMEEIRQHGRILEPEPEANTFGEVAQEWVDWKRTKIGEEIRDYTFNDLYLYNINKYIMPVFHAILISEIDFEIIDKFIGNLKREDGKPMAGSTKHNIMIPFTGIMEFSLKKGYIEKNPLDLVKPIKVNHKKPQPLSKDEIKRFLQHVSPMYRDFFAFMFFTGLRMGEAAALQWQDVKHAEGYFNVNETYVRGNVYDPKTDSSKRQVKLNGITREILVRQAKKTKGKGEHVFLNRDGRPLRADSMNAHHFKPTLKKAGLSENRSCRDTRGTFITNALDARETMGFVQNQVGHSSIKPIVNHYYNRIQRDEDGLKLEEALKSTQVLPDLEEE